MPTAHRRLAPALPLFLPVVLLLAGCSEKKAEEASADSAESAADAALPNMGGAVAPGVAFNFHYAFTLPPSAIAKVQQEHATACGKLGPSRCRVNGVHYEQTDPDVVSARTDFLLAPDLAHSFGTDAAAAVERAEGRLETATVEGEDAGGAITLSQQDSAAIQAEVARIEARLAAKGLGRQERADLSNRVEQLRDQLRGEAKLRADKERAIANTPVSFTYASESALSGNPFGAAAASSWSSAQGLFSFLLIAAGFLLPWLLPVALLVIVVRALRRRRLGTVPTA